VKRIRAKAVEGDNNIGIKSRVPPPPPSDVPPKFDQWLACLKFLTGWNDQRSYTSDEVKACFREHLTEEGIENANTVDQLCATIVPLVLDIRRIDEAVVKNMRGNILRGLRIVQVGILRIVAFELCRERDAKDAQKKRDAEKAKGKTVDLPRPKDGHDGSTYLASDIFSLAKVVRHFRFDGTFNEGLQHLITSIRRQKRVIRRQGSGPVENVPAHKAHSKVRSASRNNKTTQPPHKRPKVVSGGSSATVGAPPLHKRASATS